MFVIVHNTPKSIRTAMSGQFDPFCTSLFKKVISTVYQDVLENSMIPVAHGQFGDQGFLFQQDVLLSLSQQNLPKNASPIKTSMCSTGLLIVQKINCDKKSHTSPYQI